MLGNSRKSKFRFWPNIISDFNFGNVREIDSSFVADMHVMERRLKNLC